MNNSEKSWQDHKEAAEHAMGQGRLDLAETQWLIALRLAEDFPKEDKRYAFTLEKLAEFYFQRGKLDKAHLYCAQVLEVYSEILGPKHLDVACIAGNLAMICHARKNFREAEKQYLRALEIKNELMGPDHPEVTKLRSHYADLLRLTDREDEAEKLKTGATLITATGWKKSTGSFDAYSFNKKRDPRSLTADIPEPSEAVRKVLTSLDGSSPPPINIKPIKRNRGQQGQEAPPTPAVTPEPAPVSMAPEPESEAKENSKKSVKETILESRNILAEPASPADTSEEKATIQPDSKSNEIAEESPVAKAPPPPPPPAKKERGQQAPEKKEPPPPPPMPKPKVREAEPPRVQAEPAQAPVIRTESPTSSPVSSPSSPRATAGRLPTAPGHVTQQKLPAMGQDSLTGGSGNDDTTSRSAATAPQERRVLSKEESEERWKFLKEAAESNMAAGNLRDCEAFWHEALEIAGIFGESDPKLSYTLESLANVKFMMEKFRPAEGYYKRAYEIKLKVLGPMHIAIAGSANNLARLYYHLCEYDNAEQFSRQCINVYEKLIGPDNPNVASALHNLATLFHVQRKYKEAEPAYKRSLEIKKKILGPDHPETVKLLKSYADLLRSTNRGSEADELSSAAIGLISGTWKTFSIKDSASLASTDDRCDICATKLDGAPKCPSCGFEVSIGVI